MRYRVKQKKRRQKVHMQKLQNSFFSLGESKLEFVRKLKRLISSWAFILNIPFDIRSFCIISVICSFSGHTWQCSMQHDPSWDVESQREWEWQRTDLNSKTKRRWDESLMMMSSWFPFHLRLWDCEMCTVYIMQQLCSSSTDDVRTKVTRDLKRWW